MIQAEQTNAGEIAGQPRNHVRRVVEEDHVRPVERRVERTLHCSSAPSVVLEHGNHIRVNHVPKSLTIGSASNGHSSNSTPVVQTTPAARGQRRTSSLRSTN